MKRNIFLITVLLAAILTGCAAIPSEMASYASPASTGTASKTPEPTMSEEFVTAATATPVMPSVTEAETPVIIDAPIPDPLGDQWYDWDRVGAYPGASVVRCGDKIVFQMISGGEEMNYTCYLSFANPDGSGCVQTEIADARNPNYMDGWVYFIYEGDCIYKVKTDGSSLTRVYKEPPPERTTEVLLSDLLLVDDKLYIFANIGDADNEKSIFKCMSLDGTDTEILDEFSSFGYSKSLFYDSGKLFYINADLDNSVFDLYRYDIAANRITCLAQGLPTWYSKIAVRGDKVYHDREGMLYVYTISTEKDEPFVKSEDFFIFDFGFFDRWLLITRDDGIYLYDLQGGELYYGGGPGLAVSIVPTQNDVYVEEIDDWPVLWPLIFQDGVVSMGETLNMTD